MYQFGTHFKIAVWGESHGAQIGVAIDGVPAGVPLCEADFEHDLERRRGGAAGTTSRREEDHPHVVSGLYRGYTTGAPLTVEFDNLDTRSEDYTPFAAHFRPSHADWVAHMRSNGYNDPRGGGHFSGRLTVALTAAGVVAKKLLPEAMTFDTRVTEIGGCADPEQFPALLEQAIADGDSIGGVVECRVCEVPPCLGEPLFDSVESVISHLLFSIPGVKGVEFGSGFAAARMRGSEHNDPILNAEGATATNHAGGINGGMTNGNDLIVRVAFKPTASISSPQNTYHAATGCVEPLVIRGRHDACIALRGAVVVEAAVAIALADFLQR